jgi:hypothetical protein
VDTQIGIFGSVVVCDDIRREDNGKHILVGTYSSEIVFAGLPSAVQLRALIEYQAPTEGEAPLNFEWVVNGTSVALIEGSVNQHKRGTHAPMFIPIALPPVLLEVESESLVELFAITPEERVLLRGMYARREDVQAPFDPM